MYRVIREKASPRADTKLWFIFWLLSWHVCLGKYNRNACRRRWWRKSPVDRQYSFCWHRCSCDGTSLECNCCTNSWLRCFKPVRYFQHSVTVSACTLQQHCQNWELNLYMWYPLVWFLETWVCTTFPCSFHANWCKETVKWVHLTIYDLRKVPWPSWVTIRIPDEDSLGVKGIMRLWLRLIPWWPISEV